MHGVDSVPPAVLLHLDALTIVHLVLLGDVVTTLALFARQSDVDALFVLCHENAFRTRSPCRVSS